MRCSQFHESAAHRPHRVASDAANGALSDLRPPTSHLRPSNMARIIVLDTLSPDGLALLDAAKPKGVEYEVRTGLKGDALHDALAQFDGAICRSGVKITAEALAGNHRLKAIVRAGVGTDNIDKEAATRL